MDGEAIGELEKQVEEELVPEVAQDIAKQLRLIFEGFGLEVGDRVTHLGASHLKFYMGKLGFLYKPDPKEIKPGLHTTGVDQITVTQEGRDFYDRLVAEGHYDKKPSEPVVIRV